MNKIQLIGRPTKDPVITETKGEEGNSYVANITLAVQRIGAKENEVQADFINCVAFSKIAERIKTYVKKGQLIYVEGQLRNNNYEEADGHKAYTYKMYIQYMEFLGKKDDAEKKDDAGKKDDTGKTDDVKGKNKNGNTE